MVNTPICTFCAQTGMLCQSCQRKLDTGVITDEDIVVVRELLKLEQQFPNLKDVTIKKFIHTPDFNIIVVNRGGIANLIGPKGRILRKLEDVIHKKLKVIEEGASQLKVIEDLISPMKILGINTVYLPTGETIQKIRIQKIKRFVKDEEVSRLEDLIYKVTGKQVRLSFE